MNKEVMIPVRIEPLEDGRFLAICEAIQGCLAEGDTVAKALEEIEDVARVLLDVQREDGIAVSRMFNRVPPDAVIRAELIEDLDRA